jgi:hypothetical protein
MMSNVSYEKSLSLLPSTIKHAIEPVDGFKLSTVSENVASAVPTNQLSDNSIISDISQSHHMSTSASYMNVIPYPVS